MSLPELPSPSPLVSPPAISEAVLRETVAKQHTTEEQRVAATMQYERQSLAKEVKSTLGVITSLDQLPLPPLPPETILQNKADKVIASGAEYTKHEADYTKHEADYTKHEADYTKHETVYTQASALNDQPIPVGSVAQKDLFEEYAQLVNAKKVVGITNEDVIVHTSETATPSDTKQVIAAREHFEDVAARMRAQEIFNRHLGKSGKRWEESIGITNTPADSDARGTYIVRFCKHVLEKADPNLSLESEEGWQVIDRVLHVIAIATNYYLTRDVADNLHLIGDIIHANAAAITDVSFNLDNRSDEITTLAQIKADPERPAGGKSGNHGIARGDDPNEKPTNIS